ncbi:long-chain-fatty-acid--CoA ligase [Amylibacter cionae]|uniref:Long-chain-fatty-acid--CoA ligase n=2 Tax=Neptunicoccus cionae TaxID=2035344 RepID=A0A916QUS0_9RHOB|nr:long-chain-fatty-acid--CoA ligase [Amylibacter cionae]
MSQAAIFNEGAPLPCPVSFNLAHYVLAAGKDDAIALEVIAQTTTRWRYADLRDAVWRTAGGLLDTGLVAGDRLLLRVGNDAAFPILFLAAIAVGIVPVPTSALLTEPEVRSIVAELEPKLVAFAGGLEPIAKLGVPTLDAAGVARLRAAEPAAPVMGDPDRLAYMIYTSGTSGKPRAVMHAHRAVWARRMMWNGWYGLRADDRMLHAGAFNWTYTLGTGLLDPWAIGATAMVYTGPPDRSIWGKLVAQHRATIFAAAPGVYRQIVETGADGFDGLRHGLSAGEKMPAAVLSAWQEQTGKQVYEALGMSEVSTFVSSSPNVPPKSGTSGRVQQGRHIGVLGPDGPVEANQPGVLAVHRSDQGLMLGYMGQPAETAAKFQGDWFVTGDTVSMDEDGYITYLGRDDDMMNAGGYRVSPLEVEAAMLACEGVEHAAAAEVEVRAGVHVIAGFYVADRDLDAKLTENCARTLAKYKQPRMFVRMDTLPTGANNKVQRKALRDWKV